MSKKRFRKLWGFIRDTTLEGGDVEGLMNLTEIEDMLNEQQATINLLLELLQLSEEIVISEFSSTIDEDLDKLDKLFKKKDIKEIERYVRGCDDE